MGERVDAIASKSFEHWAERRHFVDRREAAGEFIAVDPLTPIAASMRDALAYIRDNSACPLARATARNAVEAYDELEAPELFEAISCHNEYMWREEPILFSKDFTPPSYW